MSKRLHKAHVYDSVAQPRVGRHRHTQVVVGETFHQSVVVDSVLKQHRAHRARIVPIADNVAETDENFVTDRYALLLEQTILRQPDAWLWSHNRWRRKLNKK